MKPFLKNSLLIVAAFSAGAAGQSLYHYSTAPRDFGNDYESMRVEVRTLSETLHPSVEGSGYNARGRALVGEYLDKACPKGPIDNPEMYVGQAAYLSRQTIQAGLGDDALAYAQQCRPLSWQPAPLARPQRVSPRDIPLPTGTTRGNRP